MSNFTQAGSAPIEGQLGITDDPATMLGHTPPSLGANSLARLVSDVWTLGTSLVAATITARLLGLSGKGFYSSLFLIAGALSLLFGLGLGEAAVVLSGQGRFSSRSAASATFAIVLPMSILAAAVFVPLTTALLRPASADERTAILLGGLLVTVMVCYTTSALLLLSQERVVWVAGLGISQGAITTVALWALLAVAGLGTNGAVLALIVGAVPTLAGALFLLWRIDLLPLPRWNGGFLRPALRLGLHMQFSSIVVTLAARVDLPIVYRISGASVAGSYSVALTVGALVGMVPMAISYASFPRLARLAEQEARAATAQLFRVGMLAAILVGAGLAIVAPYMIPTLFGHAYRPAVAPTLLLIPGGVLWSAQWLLARAAAARGRAEALSASFGVNFVTMVLVDLALVPHLDAVGAAVGTLLASVVGFAVAIMFYRGDGWHPADFIPRPGDLTAIGAVIRRLRP